MKLVRRLMNLVTRVSWLSTITDGPWSALGFWLNASRNTDHVGRGAYLGTKIIFRGTDVQAIKEVLIDEEYGFILQRLSNSTSPVILDVGAHIGLFALWLLKKHSHARVRSVEADPRTYDVLSQNVAFANQSGLRWDAINGAAWGDDSGQLRFSETGPSMSHRVSSSGDIIVKGVSLKSLLDGISDISGSIDLMKVDIEGSEQAFLCAAPDLLRRVRCLVVELHPYLCDTAAVLAQLHGVYSTVDMVQSRLSSKPLLMCY